MVKAKSSVARKRPPTRVADMLRILKNLGFHALCFDSKKPNRYVDINRWPRF